MKYYYNNTMHTQINRKQPIQAIHTYTLSNGILVAMFPGSRGSHPKLDFVVKILRPGINEKPEPPIHTYWVVDLMIKANHFPNEVNQLLNYYIDFYDRCLPFESVNNRQNYQMQTITYINSYFSNIIVEKTLPIDYIAYMIELFCLCEKRNEGAYMFRSILIALKEYINGHLDYMQIIKASMPMNRH